MINLIVLLQLVTIIGSRGRVYVLGEAYAFGVVWSFAFKALGVLVLRFKDRSPREWKVPFNIRLDGSEIPFGLGAIAALLFSIAGINLITKQVATISGVAFTLVFFIIFLVAEHLNERKRQRTPAEVDQFNLETQTVLSPESVDVRPGNALCLVRDYKMLAQLSKALEIVDTDKQDLVVATIRISKGPHAGYEKISVHHLFTTYEQLLFSKVVALAEKVGKPVRLLVVPSSNVFVGSAHLAAQLDSAEIIAGRSSAMTPKKQAQHLDRAWEKLPSKPERQVRFLVIEPDGKMHEFYVTYRAPRASATNAEHRRG